MSISEKLKTIAENEEKVYEAGKKSQYDEFWDSYQDYGNSVSYSNAFAGLGWTDTTFKPKYDIKPKSGYMMFRYSQITDLENILKACNVTLSFEDCTSFDYMFYQSDITKLGKFVLSNDGSQTIQDTAFNCASSLTDMQIEGHIGCKFNLQWSKKLSRDSLISIINALSSTTSGLTVTFSKTAINNAFLINIDNETTYPEGSEYYILRNSKSNWTFNYV